MRWLSDLPPISLGKLRYSAMFCPTCCHRCWNVLGIKQPLHWSFPMIFFPSRHTNGTITKLNLIVNLQIYVSSCLLGLIRYYTCNKTSIWRQNNSSKNPPSKSVQNKNFEESILLWKLNTVWPNSTKHAFYNMYNEHYLTHTATQCGKSRMVGYHLLSTACEVNPCQQWGVSDSVPKHWTVSRGKVYHPRGDPSLPQELKAHPGGQHSGVWGLP